MSTNPYSYRSQRQAYLDFIRAEVERYKETLAAAELAQLAGDVVRRLESTDQYVMTELLLRSAVDRAIVRRLELPGYRAWSAEQREQRVRRGGAAGASSPPLVATDDSLFIISNLDNVPVEPLVELMGALDAYHRAIGGGGLRVQGIKTGSQTDYVVAA